MIDPSSLPAISHQIWNMKYRYRHPDGGGGDANVRDTWRRVANALAEAERPDLRDHWAQRFYGAMEGYRFIPAGRILAGAGTGRAVTLFNCYVMGTIPDSLDGIFDALKEAALTMQQGGGIGYDFSTIRPKGAPVRGVDSDASGPLSFMDVWDAMCRTIMSAGSRRGAMMATLRCDHPDILEFVEAKRDPTRLRRHENHRLKEVAARLEECAALIREMATEQDAKQEFLMLRLVSCARHTSQLIGKVTKARGN